MKSGLSEDLIVTTINASPGNYDSSADGIVALKRGGASDKVIAAIVTKANGGPATAASGGSAVAGGGPSNGGGAPAFSAPSTVPPEVDSVGVYYQDQATGSWQEVGAEVVNIKTGGVLKHYASVGLIKGDLNGLIGGTRSKLGLNSRRRTSSSTTFPRAELRASTNSCGCA